MHTCIDAYMPRCIHAYIHTSIHPYIHTSIHPYIHTSIHPYIHTSIHPSIHPYIHTSIHPYIHISIHPYIHTSIHPYIHTSIHPYIHTSIHPSIHTYIHTYTYTHIHITSIYWLFASIAGMLDFFCFDGITFGFLNSPSTCNIFIWEHSLSKCLHQWIWWGFPDVLVISSLRDSEVSNMRKLNKSSWRGLWAPFFWARSNKIYWRPKVTVTVAARGARQTVSFVSTQVRLLAR